MIYNKVDGFIVTQPLLLILLKIIGYPNTFKDKNNRLISFCIDDNKLLAKYKITWIKIGDLKNIKLNAFPVYDGKYIKAKMRKYADKVYITLHKNEVFH